MMREEEFIADNVLICTIDADGDGKRADAALADRTEFSRSALVRLMESGSVTRDVTPIENMFLLEYLPTAPEEFLRVYLYARMLCLHPELGSDLSGMAKALHMV